MGTNYYARIIPTKKRKSEIINLIDTDDWDSILNETHITFDSFKPEDMNTPLTGIVHLGKRSGGWKFLWNPNIYVIRNGHSNKVETGPNSYSINWIEDPDTYYYIYPLTKKGIKTFIERKDIEVYDEYGEKQNKDEFWEMALNWTTWNGHEAWDGKSYELWKQSHGNTHWIPSVNDKYIQALIKNGFNVGWPYMDFYSDGLRFSTNNEFS